MTVDREAVVKRLAAAGCIAPQDEADELLRAAPDAGTLETWVVRRSSGEPLEWIVGTVRFAGLDLRIEPGVFVPRPHTELLVERAVGLLSERGRALDLCTGCGAVAAAMRAARPSATVFGLDLDPTAAWCARRNGVPAVVGDLGGAPLRDRGIDVVTAVAPYVPTDELRFLPSDVQRFEPSSALDGGADGLDLVRRIVVMAAGLLRPGGWLLTELGGDQDDALRPALDRHGFVDIATWDDGDGALRGLAAQHPGIPGT